MSSADGAERGRAMGPSAPETGPSRSEAARCEQAQRDKEKEENYSSAYPKFWMAAGLSRQFSFTFTQVSRYTFSPMNDSISCRA